MDKAKNSRLPVEYLEGLIGEIKKIGSRPRSLGRLPSRLLDHPVVAGHAFATDPVAKGYALLSLLHDAVAQLGDPQVNPRARAARHLFGLSPDTRGRLLRDRRRLAADEMGLAVRSFSKSHESEIALDLAGALYMMLLQGNVIGEDAPRAAFRRDPMM